MSRLRDTFGAVGTGIAAAVVVVVLVAALFFYVRWNWEQCSKGAREHNQSPIWACLVHGGESG